MARTTVSDYNRGRLPIPDVNRRAVSAGIATKVVVGVVLLVQFGPWYLFHAGLLAGAVTSLLLPLSKMSGSSRLIDSAIEGAVASAVGFLVLAPLFAFIYWGIMSSFLAGGEAAFLTVGFLPVELFARVLLSLSGGFIGGVAVALLYWLFLAVR